MARIRSVKPEFFENEDLVALGYPSMLLFIGLWQHCDVAGRCEDRPMKLKARVFPYTDEPVEALLSGLEERGFIVRYEVDGERYIWVKTFRQHQRITGKEYDAGSKRPAAPGDDAFPLKPGPKPTNKPATVIEEAPEPTHEEPVKHEGNTGETPGRCSDVLEGKGREGSNYKKVYREEPLFSDSPGDEPSNLSGDESRSREFWTSAGKSKDPLVRSLCKAAYGIPKFRSVIPPDLSTVQKVLDRIRDLAPHDAAIADEIGWFEIYWGSQSKLNGKGHWWLSFGQWCKKSSGKWALAKKRGGLIAVAGGMPEIVPSTAEEIQAERRRTGL